MRAVLFVLLAAFCLTGQAQQDSFLVKPYLQFATQTGIFILWETTAPATTVVRYGEAQLRASKPNLENEIKLEGTRKLHEVALSGLRPDTKYLYQVESVTKSGQTLTSEVYSFATAVEDGDAIFFALVGDTQENPRTPWAWGKIAQRVWEDRPNFIVHAGDLVDKGTKKTDWTEHFFPFGQVVMSRFPMYTVLGNHEQDAQHYYDYMVNPAPEYYYTFRYGNAQFFMIDTNRDVMEGSEQYNWLEWELAKSDARWKFVVHHHPPYSSDENDHGDTWVGQSELGTHARQLVPLYEAYGVDFCLFGHTHLYERTWPLFENVINQKDGVIYINSGGAGGGLEDFAPTRSWFTIEQQRTHHYCTFAIYDGTLIFKAIDHDGRMFDSFEMTKPADNAAGRTMNTPPAPHIQLGNKVFEAYTMAEIIPFDTTFQIVYTTDGSEPTLQSERYTQPIRLTASGELKTRVYTADGRASRVVKSRVEKMPPMPATAVERTEPGLLWTYYEGKWEYVPNFQALTSLGQGVVATVSEADIPHKDDQFGVVMEGFVEVPSTDTYTFFTRSDDGSKLYIDGRLVVDNDGQHGAFYAYGDIILQAGLHRVRIEYFESSGTEMLRAGLVDKTLGRVPFHPGMLSH